MLLVIGTLSMAQSIVCGFIQDKTSGERLIGATIHNSETLNGAITDQNGYFSLSINTPVTLKISFVGYKVQTLSLSQANDTIIDVLLEPSIEMDEVVIKWVRAQLASMNTMNGKELASIPSLSGKPDIMKSIQLLPGITSPDEGTSLILVRGGDPGQNLYLFDGVSVIYVNHLGGFMSVFNPDIINSIDVFKGGFPARYGGRLSSVLDITQRDGNIKEYKASLSIGITDGSFSIEGPGGLKNSSFIVSGRKTFIDALMAGFLAIDKGSDFIAYYGFYDVNAKYTWKPNSRNSVHVNLYQGDDYFNYHTYYKNNDEIEKTLYSNKWGNWFSSIQWKNLISHKLFMTSSLSFTRYRLRHLNDFERETSNGSETFTWNYLSSVSDLMFQTNFRIKLMNGWTTNIGLQSSSKNYVPNQTIQSNTRSIQDTGHIQIFETALYGENVFEFSNWIKAKIGLRIPTYINGSYSSLTVEPRVSFDLRFAENQHLVCDYMKVTQPTHLLITQGSLFNNEVWIPADENIAPAKSTQYSISWLGSFYDAKYQTEITAFSKSMTNLSTYKEGFSNLMGDGNWRSKIVGEGMGTSKGVEFIGRKTTGDWTGFLSYSFSKTTRQYPDINNGLEYIYDYHRPHVFSINLNKKINTQWTANLSWIYQTGKPFTPVIARQYTLNPDKSNSGYPQYYETLLYGDRNSANMRDYHRLDIGLRYETISKRNRKTIWTFSVYNLYNRKNPIYYFYDTSGRNGIENPMNLAAFKPTNLYQMSYFPVIPSVSYKVFFEKPGTKDQKINKYNQPDIQNSSKWIIQANYGKIDGLLLNRNNILLIGVPHIQLVGLYRILPFLDLGLSIGGSEKSYPISLGPITPENTINAIHPYIGIKGQIHPLQMISKKNDPAFDIYCFSNYGGPIVIRLPNIYKSEEGYNPKFGFGVGIAFNFWKSLGVFAEYQYTNPKPGKIPTLRYGCLVRF